MRFTELPRVTIQLPIFNERFVVERLLEETSKIDYPRHLLQIQVLDDSTDDTHPFTEELVREYRDSGLPIEYIHRTNRHGYKAGALRKRAQNRHRRSGRGFRRRLRPAARFPPAHRALFHRSEGRHGADALDLPEPQSQRPDRSAGDPARWPLCAGTHRARRRRAVFQFQRHGGHPAPVDDRGRRRLAARHAHRGFRFELSRPAQGLEVRIRAHGRVPLGAAGRDLRIPGAAVALGQGTDPGRDEAVADDSAIETALAREGWRRFST